MRKQERNQAVTRSSELPMSQRDKELKDLPVIRETDDNTKDFKSPTFMALSGVCSKVYTFDNLSKHLKFKH